MKKNVIRTTEGRDRNLRQWHEWKKIHSLTTTPPTVFTTVPNIISHIMTTLQKKNKTTRLWFSRRGWCQWSRTPCVIPILIPHQWIDHPWNEKKDWSSDSSPLSLSWQNHSSYYVPPLLPTIPPWKDSRRWSQTSSTIVYTAGERTGTIIISQPIFDRAANLSWKKTP